MKTHMNLATTDLGKSVQFYSALLEAQPKKLLGDYALFITEQPGLELALNVNGRVSPSSDVHYGLYVDSTDEVERAIDRLELAGLVASIEREETCCYAQQTKVWAIDPDGRRWEVYTVHQETEERDPAETDCCSAGGGDRSCCAA